MLDLVVNLQYLYKGKGGSIMPKITGNFYCRSCEKEYSNPAVCCGQMAVPTGSFGEILDFYRSVFSLPSLEGVFGDNDMQACDVYKENPFLLFHRVGDLRNIIKSLLHEKKSCTALSNELEKLIDLLQAFKILTDQNILENVRPPK